jgi:putative ABC transport system ATP-binding protein
MPPETTPLIRSESLDIGFASTPLATALNFEVHAGEKLRITGPSGCGKSTLLRTLCRLTEPLAGTVYFEGTRIEELDPLRYRRQCLLVPQVPVLAAGTIRDNLALCPSWAVAPKLDDVAERLAALGLELPLERNVQALSLGEQQRITVLRALLANPKVLLLDEPTSALDEQNALGVAAVLSNWVKGERRGLIVVTHDPHLSGELETESFALKSQPDIDDGSGGESASDDGVSKEQPPCTT